MPNIDVSQMKPALSAIKERLRKQKANPADYFSQAQDAFRQGIESRQKALALLATITQPYTPTYLSIDAPFLIWVVRDGNEDPTILIDSHIEPGNSWAKIAADVDSGGDFGFIDQLNFYFFWQNDTGSDAVVNVVSHLMVNGYCSIGAHSGWIWTPFWGASTIGHTQLWVDAGLTLLEWWNQPPTEPLRQPGQLANVATLSADGGWGPFVGGGRTETPSDNFHLNYDTFLIPRGAAAVFEVSLKLTCIGYNGDCTVNFNNYGNALVLCPHLQLELMTGPPTALS
jgi:hypothetical protein